MKRIPLAHDPTPVDVAGARARALADADDSSDDEPLCSPREPAFASLAGVQLPAAIAAMAVIGYILSLVTLYLMGIIVNSVSPSFNGKSDLHQSLKLLTYASTPTWLAGLVGWIPILGALVSFAANVYVVYLIYLGLQPVLGVPKEKVAGFTVVIVLIYVVLSLIVSGIIIGLLFSTFFAGGATGALSGA
jgi:hypothetical protein